MRKFETGATRDDDHDKLDFEGFLHPLVLEMFGKYMHKHRFQADGEMRDSDNWQKGMSKSVYMKSLFRHFMDLWALHRGTLMDGQSDVLVNIVENTDIDWEDQINEMIEDSLAAIMFNVMGYTFEHIKEVANHEEDDDEQLDLFFKRGSAVLDFPRNPGFGNVIPGAKMDDYGDDNMKSDGYDDGD